MTDLELAPPLIEPPDLDERMGPTPPNDLAAEMSVLGALLVDPRTFDDVAEVVSGKDFYRLAHEDIFDTIADLALRGEPVDMASVAKRLRERELLTKVGGADYLHTLYAGVGVTTSATYHAQTIADLASDRRLILAGQKVVQIGFSTAPSAEKREDARAAVDAAALARDRSQARTLADLYAEVVEIAEKGSPKTLPTGFHDIDRRIGGIAPGRLLTFAASPGIGKSIIGLNIALHIARRYGHAVLFHSLEMTDTEVMQRLVANVASVNLGDLMNATVSERDWQRVANAKATIEALPLVIDDRPRLGFADIRKSARDLQRKRDDLALVVIDYLGLMAHPKAERHDIGIAETTGRLKGLAKETGACVLQLVQLNREGGKRDTGPRMTDLADSAAIERDSDAVILGWEPERDLPEVEWVIDKNRHGPTGAVRLQKWGHYARLTSVGQE